MPYHHQVWQQLKNLTPGKISKALEKDGWVREERSGAVLAYRKGTNRITVHFHPKKTYPPKLLKALLSKIGWSEADLKRLKLIKDLPP